MIVTPSTGVLALPAQIAGTEGNVTRGVPPAYSAYTYGEPWPYVTFSELAPLAETFGRTIDWAVEQGLVTRPLPGRPR